MSVPEELVEEIMDIFMIDDPAIEKSLRVEITEVLDRWWPDSTFQVFYQPKDPWDA